MGNSLPLIGGTSNIDKTIDAYLKNKEYDIDYKTYEKMAYTTY